MGALFLANSANRQSSIFTIHNVKKTWTESRAVCRETGGHLLSIQSSKEWEMWKHLLKSTIHSLGRFSGPFWSGLHSPNASDLNTFTWDDCSVPVYLNKPVSDYVPSYDPCVNIELQREVFSGVFIDLWLKGKNCNDSLPLVCETEILDCLPMKCDEAVINTSDGVCNTELCKFVANDTNTCQVHPIDADATLCHVFMPSHQRTDFFSVCYISNPNHTVTRCLVDLTINYNVTISEDYRLSACLTVERTTARLPDVQPRTTEGTLCTCPCKDLQFLSNFNNGSSPLVQGMLKELTIDRKNTSKNRMRKECAKDNRPSSVSIGAVGLAIIVVPLGLIIVLDLPQFYVDLPKMIRTIRSALK
ncbi:hypothetical protein ACJMK2_005055 [Sinanodonta woodiana]|uniref:C-type lectin domain-containing protein n=1 Tax=Sinanodonta woodiana TaxID=1069815 RepID=A0ABD3VSB0_SINWO